MLSVTSPSGKVVGRLGGNNISRKQRRNDSVVLSSVLLSYTKDTLFRPEMDKEV